MEVSSDDKQLKGGWKLHESNRLQCKQARSLSEKARERDSEKEPSCGQNKPQQVGSRIWVRIGSILCPKAY